MLMLSMEIIMDVARLKINVKVLDAFKKLDSRFTKFGITNNMKLNDKENVLGVKDTSLIRLQKASYDPIKSDAATASSMNTNIVAKSNTVVDKKVSPGSNILFGIAIPEDSGSQFSMIELPESTSSQFEAPTESADSVNSASCFLLTSCFDEQDTSSLFISFDKVQPEKKKSAYEEEPEKKSKKIDVIA